MQVVKKMKAERATIVVVLMWCDTCGVMSKGREIRVNRGNDGKEEDERKMKRGRFRVGLYPNDVPLVVKGVEMV